MSMACSRTQGTRQVRTQIIKQTTLSGISRSKDSYLYPRPHQLAPSAVREVISLRRGMLPLVLRKTIRTKIDSEEQEGNTILKYAVLDVFAFSKVD